MVNMVLAYNTTFWKRFGENSCLSIYPKLQLIQIVSRNWAGPVTFNFNSQVQRHNFSSHAPLTKVDIIFGQQPDSQSPRFPFPDVIERERTWVATYYCYPVSPPLWDNLFSYLLSPFARRKLCWPNQEITIWYLFLHKHLPPPIPAISCWS